MDHLNVPPAPAAASRFRLESTIAHIWRDILGVDSVVAEDDFFRLGGDSLLAVQMLAAVEEVLLAPVSFVDFIEEPTVAGLAGHVAQTRAQPAAAEAPLDRAPAEGPIPCTPAQERLWFIEQMTDAEGVYNLPLGVRLRGPVDADALERSLQEIVRRHAALRTTFTTEDGQPVQVVSPEGALVLERHDLRGLPDPEAEAQRQVDELSQAAFDLERGPLMAAQLLRLAEEDHVLQLVFHHIICDGGSHVVVFRELESLYGAYVRGEEPSLPAPRTQFPDYARRQQSLLGGPALEERMAHWREKLAGMPMALELPTDRPRPPIPTYRGATRRSRMPGETVSAARAFSRDEGATIFATLLAAFDAVLHRYTGQETIVVGSSTSGRDRAELEDCIGFLVGTVVLRTDLAGEPSFRELVGRVRGVVLDAVAHQDAPFERLVAELQPERDLSRHPLFQVFFAHVPHAPLAIADAEPFDARPATSRFDLTVWIEEETDGLDLVWEYSTDLFDAPTIEQLERHFLRLLDGALADPEQPITKLPLLSEAEREELVREWSATQAEYPVATLHELFEAQVARTPDAPAASHEGTTVTYRELNERANRLAHRLRGLGVGPDTPVALCLKRSVEMVVAILGVLKSGGAYVPLDPDYPSDRLAFMLDDTGAPVLVTEERLIDGLPEHRAIEICLDVDAQLREQSTADPEPLGDPENVAYVIYTSGSTGQPKGVQVEHRNVARLFSATEEWFGFGPGDTWLLFHSYAFDFSVWELWGALLYGGRVVVAPHWTMRSPEALAALLDDEHVTVFNATPSLFGTALDELLKHSGTLALRYVIFGGEALRPAGLRPWFERFGDGGPTLVNMYGITETTVHVTYRPLHAADVERESSPIGRPIPDLQLYLLDANMSPVPNGVTGELYVGGAGVARGYLNRPELTSERFLPNPSGPGRLYRTGDHARYRGQGNFEFLGRIDDQVKIRGFRIELGEIQSALEELETVAEGVVTAFEAGPGDTRLAAYLVPAEGANEEALRRDVWAHLEERLPAHMIPSSLALLDRFPLTPNGKLDRKALPAPVPEQQSATTFAAPQTPTEQFVADVWREILGIEQVSADDNFFRLGGHSLLAARVVTQVRERFAVELSVRALFEHATIAAFAAHVDALRSREAAGAEDAPQVGRHHAGAYPLSFTQEQLLFFDLLAPGSAVYNAALPVRVDGPLSPDALEAALASVIERHEVLRTVLVTGPDGAEQALLDRWDFELPIVDLAHHDHEARETELSRLLREHARRPFDLGRDLMLRATLFRLAEDEHVVLLQTHHIAFDAWAVAVFFEELGELYQAQLEGREARLPELALQYRDFALWQRERLSGEMLEREVEFWRSQLAGAPTVLALPTDRPRPPRQTFEGATHEFALPRRTADGVLALCRAHDATPYMVLLAAFGTFLYRLTGQDDILVGSPNANRDRVEFERLIGFLANTLVLRVRLGGNPAFTSLLDRVRTTALATYDHEELPFERIVDAVRPERDSATNPLFQVNFRVRTGPRPALRLGDAQTRLESYDAGFARFDLALELHVDDDGIGCEFSYNTELFDRDTIVRFARDFEALVDQILAAPETPLLSLELSSGDVAGENGRGPRAAGIRGFRDASRA